MHMVERCVSSAVQGDNRPIAELPFHLELVWHEAPTGADQPMPAVAQQTPADPRTSARHEQRRSTVGQRFFRAVVSRASRMANRRQAVAADDDEERRRSSARASAEVPHGQPGTVGGDWVVHQRSRGAGGSLGPVDAVSHTLELVREEAEVEPLEVSMPTKSPLPPIGEHADVHVTSSEVQETTEVEPVEELVQSDEQPDNLFVKRQTSSVSSSGTSSAHAVRHPPKSQGVFETTEPQLPGLIEPRSQTNLPNIHSRQGSGKLLPQIGPKFGEGKPSDKVSSKEKIRNEVAKSEQHTHSATELIANDSAEGDLASKKGDSKSPTSSRIALEPDAVEHDKESKMPSSPAAAAPTAVERSSPGGAGSPPAPQSPPPAPAPGSAPVAVAARQPAAAAPAEMAAAAAAAIQQRQSVTSAASSATVVPPSGAATLPTEGVSTYHAVRTDEPSVGGEEGHQGPVEDGASPESPLSSEESPEVHQDGLMAGSARGQKERKVSDASTGTPTGKKGRKHHHRRSHVHKKKKKRGHLEHGEEAVLTEEDHGAESEPMHEWLKPNPPKAPDAVANTEGSGSTYFSPSEFQHLAVHHHHPATASEDDDRSQRRGPVTTALQSSDSDDKHTSIARTASKKLRDILPAIGVRPSEPKPSPSRGLARLPSHELAAVHQETPKQPSTSQDPGTTERVSPTASPVQSSDAEADMERES